MGYFRPRLRRRRCAASVDAAVRRQAGALWDCWLPVPPRPPAVRRRDAAAFLRFAVGTIDADSHQQLGIFQAVCELEESGRLTEEQLDALGENRQWFNRHLHAPGPIDPRAVYWFKSGATECVARIWERVHLLREHGVPVWLMRTRQPGRVRYEDDLQVGAVPFHSRAWTRRVF